MSREEIKRYMRTFFIISIFSFFAIGFLYGFGFISLMLLFIVSLSASIRSYKMYKGIE